MTSTRKIFEHKFFDYPELEETYINDQRHYKVPGGGLYKSVTTIIGEKLDKSEVLQKWRDRLGAEEADRVTRFAANKGTKIHAICEKYLLNDEKYLKGVMPLHLGLFKAIKPYIDNISTVFGIECPLFSNVLKTAGRSDCIAAYNDKISIIDFKGSMKTKKEEWIENYFIQETTYAIMFEEMFGIKIDQIVTIISPDYDQPQVFVKDKELYIQKVKEIFIGS